jgi:two-component system, cell cycle response regulator
MTTGWIKNSLGRPTNRDVSMGRIVVAEDSALLRAMACRTLIDHGYVVHDASDGLEALERIRRHRPDVVLCDLAMPRLDGYGVLEAMQADPAVADTPVVFLTSHTRSDQAAEGLRRGAYDYLRKPFDGVELIARMQAAVRTKRLQDELQRLLSTDPLTALANRRRAEQALTAAIMGGASGVSVAILDVDLFKRVNDEHGHEAGDAVLKETAARLEGVAGPDATVARWGGEEFLFVCERSASAGDLARLAHEAVRSEAFALRGGDALRVTLSAGWSAWRGDDDIGGLLRRADIALYAAKESGRDRVVGPSRTAASA